MARFDGVVEKITCSCGIAHEKTIKWLRAGGEFTCECGMIIECRGEKLDADLTRADEIIDRFRANIKRTARRWR